MRYSTGPMNATTKSMSGNAQAKKPAAIRRGSERGGASRGAVARARSAPDSAWVRVSTSGQPRALEPVGAGEPLFLQERRIEQLRLVARARVREDRDDRVSRAEILREADRAGDVDAARAAEAQAFGAQQVEHDRERFRVGDPVGVVDRCTLDVLRHAPLPDSLRDRRSFRF